MSRRGVSVMEIVLFLIIILFATILQTSTGFGFSTLATPLLLFLFGPAEAIQINLILSLLLSLALIKSIREYIDYGMLKRFILGSSIGVFIGIAFFILIDINSLKMFVGLVILLLSVLLLFQFSIIKSRRKERIVGGISGSLTSSIGMPGPPLLLYFSRTDNSKEVVRSTTLAYYLFIYSVSLVVQIIFVGTSETTWISSLWGLPVVFAGLFLGQVLFKWISQSVFQIIIYIILFATGISLLADSLGWL